MPKTKSQQIKEILLRKAGFDDISTEDLGFAEEVEEKLSSFKDPLERDEYYNSVRERYESVNELKKAESVASVSDLSSSEKHENLGSALEILSGIESKYEKMNPIGRFFSHFVPNSWTSAGRLREEIKSCNDTMKAAGIDGKDVENYYREEWGHIDPDFRNDFVAASARVNHWFNSGAEKALRKYAKEYLIDEPIDLSVLYPETKTGGNDLEKEEEEIVDREPMVVPEAAEEDYPDIPESTALEEQPKRELDSPEV